MSKSKKKSTKKSPLRTPKPVPTAGMLKSEHIPIKPSIYSGDIPPRHLPKKSPN